MTSNRLTNKEIYELRQVSEEIKRLCSFEASSFDMDPVKDDYIKKRIRPWLMWFEVEAQKIDDILNTDRYAR